MHGVVASRPDEYQQARTDCGDAFTVDGYGGLPYPLDDQFH